MTVVKNEEKNAKQCYFLGSATVIYYVHVGCMPGSTIWCSTRVFDVHARSGSTMCMHGKSITLTTDTRLLETK